MMRRQDVEQGEIDGHSDEHSEHWMIYALMSQFIGDERRWLCTNTWLGQRVLDTNTEVVDRGQRLELVTS